MDIKKNNQSEWDKVTEKGVTFIPDPLLLRSADMFLMGQKRFRNHQIDPQYAWSIIDENLSAILVFFDLLVTREKIPIIDYKWSFEPGINWGTALQGMALTLHVKDPAFGSIRDLNAEKIESLNLNEYSEESFKEIAKELKLYGWEWVPDLKGLKIKGSEPNKIAFVGFLLTQMIFGSYAQITGSEHIVLPTRSAAFAEYTLPNILKSTKTKRSAIEKEQIIFGELKNVCLHEDNIRGREFPAVPSILPDLLSSKPKPKTVEELLNKALDFRKKRKGRAYRKWRQLLREAWDSGKDAPTQKNEIQEIIKEIKQRQQNEWGIIELPGGFEISFDTVTIKGIKVPYPPRLRNWIIDFRDLIFRPHKRVLLGMAQEQKLYFDLSIHLKKLWEASDSVKLC